MADLLQRLEMSDDLDARDAAAEIKRLRAALQQCGSKFDTGPTTIQGAADAIAAEFERRMNIAANALNDGTVPPPTAVDERRE